ncbi:MAG: branched-chain amino acid ABC transporter permease [Egibacteraceae bacterium]
MTSTQAAADEQEETPAPRWTPKARGQIKLVAVLVAVTVVVFAAAEAVGLSSLTIFTDALRTATGPSAAVYALLAIGLNMHFGYTGLLNFGQVGFMLVGAYGVAIGVSTFGLGLWVGILISIGLAVVLALLLGAPTLRLRADYLAITTIAAAEILRFIFRSSDARPVTNGVFGLRGFADEFYRLNPIPPGDYDILLLTLSSRRLWVIVVGWSLVTLISLFMWALMRSPWGRVIKSIREDEDAARSLGKNVFSYKMQSLVIGGVVGAIGGVVFSLTLQTVQPDTFQPQLTFFAYTVLILGGAARILGPIVGSVIFWFIVAGFDSFLRRAAAAELLPPEYFGSGSIGATRFALVGLGLMLLMVYRPQGLLGDRREMQLDAK